MERTRTTQNSNESSSSHMSDEQTKSSNIARSPEELNAKVMMAAAHGNEFVLATKEAILGYNYDCPQHHFLMKGVLVIEEGFEDEVLNSLSDDNTIEKVNFGG